MKKHPLSLFLVFTRILRALLVLLIFTLPLVVKAQLSVSTSMTPAQLVQNVLVGGGVSVSGVTYTGAASAIGHFTTGGTATNLGISSGILMSSGVVNGSPAIGSISTNQVSTANGTGSDPQLAALGSGGVYDASVLEFNFVPLSDTIKFKYVFASEEYPEFVGTGVNDIFGFFISGPNPAGGSYSNKNIALIPNTSIPIAIDNVNSSSHSQYYVDNQSGISVVFDGFTTVLTAWCRVTPCQSYHLKLAIGDVGDDIYDSGVFLEANSFTSNSVAINTTYTATADTMAIEGCNDAVVHFNLSTPATSPYVVNYTVGGTAQSGIDYVPVPTTITIPTGQTSASITISPFLDGVTEPNESVTLTIPTSVCGNIQVYTVYIRDNSHLDAIGYGDTLICGGQTTLLITGVGGIPPYAYIWNNSLGTSASPVVGPATSTLYISTVTDACGVTAVDSVMVDVGGGYANAGSDVTICSGETANLIADGGITYHWSNNVNTAANPVSPAVTTTYYVTATSSCDGYDSVTVIVMPAPVITAIVSNDSICAGQNTILNAGGGLNYNWTSNPSDPSLSGQQTLVSPVVSPDFTTIYTVTGTDNNSCQSTASVTAFIKPNPTAAFSIIPPRVCIGENTIITFTGSAGSGTTYNWDFNGGTTYSGSGAGPYQVNWIVDGSKTVTLSIDDNGCLSNIANNAVLVTPNPTANFDAVNTAGCVPLVVYFHDSSTNVDQSTSYLWDFGNGQTSTLSNPAYTYINAGTFNVTLTVYNGDDCFDSIKINNLVRAYPKPNAGIGITPQVVSIFDPVVYFYDHTTGLPPPISWQWTLGDGETSTIQNLVHTYADTGKYAITLTVYNSYGCVDSTSDYVWVQNDNTIYLPNTFTPNNDQSNDVFLAYGINLQKFNMKVFDRWGNMIYNSDDINQGWDGKYKGNKVADGIYAWTVDYIDAIGREHIIFGSVNLYR
jgi:gliding motility-associated-like protein